MASRTFAHILWVATASILLCCPDADAQVTTARDGTNEGFTNPFAGTWVADDAMPSNLSGLPTCVSLEFAFVVNDVTVGCSFRDSSAQAVRTTDLYSGYGSASRYTLPPGIFRKALIDRRILELHDIKDRVVVRVRWYEMSPDGRTVTATSGPSTGVHYYQRPP
jgi:hypothetical protein